MSDHHVAIWMDHNEAKIFQIDPDRFDETSVKAPHQQLSRKEQGQGRHANSKEYFDQVAAGLKDATQILLVGPSSAKLDFIRHLHTHDLLLEKRIVGVETLDHPTDGQLVAYVHHYFNDK